MGPIQCYFLEDFFGLVVNHFIPSYTCLENVVFLFVLVCKFMFMQWLKYISLKWFKTNVLSKQSWVKQWRRQALKGVFLKPQALRWDKYGRPMSGLCDLFSYS